LPRYWATISARSQSEGGNGQGKNAAAAGAAAAIPNLTKIQDADHADCAGFRRFFAVKSVAIRPIRVIRVHIGNSCHGGQQV